MGSELLASVLRKVFIGLYRVGSGCRPLGIRVFRPRRLHSECFLDVIILYIKFVGREFKPQRLNLEWLSDMMKIAIYIYMWREGERERERERELSIVWFWSFGLRKAVFGVDGTKEGHQQDVCWGISGEVGFVTVLLRVHIREFILEHSTKHLNKYKLLV